METPNKVSKLVIAGLMIAVGVTIIIPIGMAIVAAWTGGI